MKKLFSYTISVALISMIYFILISMIYSCGNKTDSNTASAISETEEPLDNSTNQDIYDPKRGEGKYTAENVGIKPALDATMATYGEKVSATKCTSCHKLTDEKLVGPGWQGVTLRRTPEWIMNFITNPDPMIDKDPEAQAMLEICLVRMPNQNLADEEARSILEYMRQLDGVK